MIIGATPEGKKELVGFTDGIRESSQSWRDLLLDLKRRGLTTASEIAVAKPALAKAGGALGFWKALGEVWPTAREQRCWVHKTANILNKMPKSLHTKAKRSLQEIWMAETKKDAVKALEAFVETYQVKYKRATDCLINDRDALLAFYDFPAEHWKHLRTTNPIESASACHSAVRSCRRPMSRPEWPRTVSRGDFVSVCGTPHALAALLRQRAARWPRGIAIVVLV